MPPDPGEKCGFITIAERDLMLPNALTKRLVNHAPPTMSRKATLPTGPSGNYATPRRESPTVSRR